MMRAILQTSSALTLERKRVPTLTSKGSVSPSKATMTGAFMLQRRAESRNLHLGNVKPDQDQQEEFLREGAQTYLICRALVPSTRARSYLVM